MSHRLPRKTEPQDTLLGLLVSYDEIRPHLVRGEAFGREWIHARATELGASPYVTVEDVLDLHKAAFGHLYSWAGTPRLQDAGPGGVVYVPHYEVRLRLHELTADFRAWYDASPPDWDMTGAAELIARTHHGFEYIHPFPDTNGRTGRLLDHLVLWSSLGTVSDDAATSPLIDHFPDDRAVGDYFQALHDASNRRDYTRLTAYYVERLEETFPG